MGLLPWFTATLGWLRLRPIGLLWLIGSLVAMPATLALAAPNLPLGIETLQEGNYEAAIEVLTQALEQEVNPAVVYSNRCLAYLQLDRYDEAIADCSQAIAHSSNNLDAYLNRGLAYYHQGHYGQARGDYDQVIGLRPFDHRAHYNRGLVAAATQNYGAAIADFNRAMVQIAPTAPLDLAQIYSDRGTARLMQHNSSGAIADFNQAIRLDGAQVRAYFNRACACHQQGQYIAALQDIDRVLQRMPHHAQAHLQQGLLLQQLGDDAGAIASLHHAAQCFCDQGAMVAYHHTLDLIDQMQRGRSALG